MSQFRELTEYEKERWYDNLNRFEMDEPDFIETGCEPDEAFNAALSCTSMRDYGLSDWFVKAAEIQCLDMYYDQIFGYYVEMWDIPTDHGLPSLEDFLKKALEMNITTIHYYGEAYDDNERRLWDWAMDWRKEHEEETRTQNEKQRLESRLNELTNKARIVEVTLDDIAS